MCSYSGTCNIINKVVWLVGDTPKYYTTHQIRTVTSALETTRVLFSPPGFGHLQGYHSTVLPRVFHALNNTKFPWCVKNLR